MTDVRTAVRKYVEDNFIMGSAAVKPRDDDSFMDLHILDSTGFLELIAHLEETYGFVVKDEEMTPENLDSLNKVTAFVEKKLAA